MDLLMQIALVNVAIGAVVGGNVAARRIIRGGKEAKLRRARLEVRAELLQALVGKVQPGLRIGDLVAKSDHPEWVWEEAALEVYRSLLRKVLAGGAFSFEERVRLNQSATFLELDPDAARSAEALVTRELAGTPGIVQPTPGVDRAIASLAAASPVSPKPRKARPRPTASERKSAFSKGDSFYSKIVGVSKRNADGQSRQKLIEAHCQPDTRLAVIREPGNPFDSNAIALAVKGLRVGYIERHLAEDLAPYIDAGGSLDVVVADITGGGEGYYSGVNINITCA